MDGYQVVVQQSDGRLAALRAYKNGTLVIRWWKTTRAWAEIQGWPTPLFGFKKAFISKTLENDDNFHKAVMESGIDVYVPDDMYDRENRRFIVDN